MYHIPSWLVESLLPLLQLDTEEYLLKSLCEIFYIKWKYGKPDLVWFQARSRRGERVSKLFPILVVFCYHAEVFNKYYYQEGQTFNNQLIKNLHWSMHSSTQKKLILQLNVVNLCTSFLTVRMCAPVWKRNKKEIIFKSLSWYRWQTVYLVGKWILIMFRKMERKYLELNFSNLWGIKSYNSFNYSYHQIFVDWRHAFRFNRTTKSRLSGRVSRKEQNTKQT